MDGVMDTGIPISYLNDFIFCPLSIYYHQLYGGLSTRLYHEQAQINGKAAHEAIDERRYSTRKTIIQGLDVYSDEFNLYGKIDLYDSKKGLLTERKKHISTIYDGYVFQLYAQYYCLVEMGYAVTALRFYSSDDNKTYDVPLPDDHTTMRDAFKRVVDDINCFSPEGYRPVNEAKCRRCIYESLCDRSLI